MSKYITTVSITPELLRQVKDVQLSVTGSSNISGLVEKLLIEWLQQFRRID